MGMAGGIGGISLPQARPDIESFRLPMKLLMRWLIEPLASFDIFW